MGIKTGLRRICNRSYEQAWITLHKKCVINSGELSVPELVSSLSSYEIVSFDIFDTLIFRRVERPTDLFYIVGDRLGIADFRDRRICAEIRAREIEQQKTGTSEINIYDIYNSFGEGRIICNEDLIRAEMKAEYEYCYANPYMKEVYDGLINNGKRVIITSDMYIPHDMMSGLLKNCGYDNWEHLYVSCDEKITKYTGELYIRISGYLNCKKEIVHVGDNLRADVMSATRHGWVGRHYVR